MDIELSRERLSQITPSLTDDQRSYMDEAVSLIEAAEERNIPMRLLGSTAFLINCPNNVALFQSMNRPLTDIDLVAYLKQDKQIANMLADMGYVVKGGQGVTMNVFINRKIYVHKEGVRRDVDIFFDKLDFCHPIDFKGRLDVSGYYTVPLSDLLLEKMQIVEINEKDIKDTIILLLEHELGSDERTTICRERLTHLLRDDWGFYYTVTTNLGKVRGYAERSSLLGMVQKAEISERIESILRMLDEVPKTRKWRWRARIGARKRWYNEIGEGYREIGEKVMGE